MYALAICMLDSQAVRNFHRISTESHDEMLREISRFTLIFEIIFKHRFLSEIR